MLGFPFIPLLKRPRTGNRLFAKARPQWHNENVDHADALRQDIKAQCEIIRWGPEILLWRNPRSTRLHSCGAETPNQVEFSSVAFRFRDEPVSFS